MVNSKKLEPLASAVLSPALVCKNGEISIQEVPAPQIGPSDVLIEVQFVGLCRTDMYAMAGQIPTKAGGLIPGHEFSGRAVAVGSEANDHWLGKTVVANPVFACNDCEVCQLGKNHLCADVKMMGVEVDGACRQQIALDLSQVFEVDELDPKEAVFAEPLAATLGILNADIDPDQVGLLLGRGRIAELANRLLLAKGFHRITVADLEQASQLPSSKFDFVVETGVCAETIRQMVRLAKPHGRLVLKSRQHTPFEITLREIVSRQQTLQLVHYGCFEEAVDLLKTGKVSVDDLVGDTFSFPEFRDAIAAAQKSESTKILLANWS